MGLWKLITHIFSRRDTEVWSFSPGAPFSRENCLCGKKDRGCFYLDRNWGVGSCAFDVGGGRVEIEVSLK